MIQIYAKILLMNLNCVPIFIFCRICYHVIEEENDVQQCIKCEKWTCRDCSVDCEDCDKRLECDDCIAQYPSKELTTCCATCGLSLCDECGFLDADNDDICHGCFKEWMEGRRRVKKRKTSV